MEEGTKGVQIQVLCLPSKHFPDWAISPPLVLLPPFLAALAASKSEANPSTSDLQMSLRAEAIFCFHLTEPSITVRRWLYFPLSSLLFNAKLSEGQDYQPACSCHINSQIHTLSGLRSRLFGTLSPPLTMSRIKPSYSFMSPALVAVVCAKCAPAMQVKKWIVMNEWVNE